MTTDRALIFGGTFDPPHRAHIELPQRIASKIGADRILYVPTSANPLKDDTPTPAGHRLAMLDIALRECDACEISTIEIDATGPSYTVDTLEKLRKQLGGTCELRFLIGADAAVSFHRWKSPKRILELATPVVMFRPPYDRPALREALEQVYAPAEVSRWMSWTVDAPMIDIDATSLRKRLERGESPSSEVIDPAVLGYIRANGLYS